MDKLTVSTFKSMLASGAANLENYANEINALNVFPVPDGDTGSNMSMTFSSGYSEAIKCQSESISQVAKALSKGLLMGARGNSGVITSQIFRGFYQSIEDKDELTVNQIAEAFENGTRVAYKAIMKPVEGTILTVIREASWYANNDLRYGQTTIEDYFKNLVKYTLESVERTPEYLPILKEAGVVDSGGMGIYRILQGFCEYINGKPVEFKQENKVVENTVLSNIDHEEFGYCTEFILRLNVDNFDENKLKVKLAEMGESLVVVQDDDLVKVHVHTLKPGDALNIAQRYGEFVKLKIENMSEQHSHIIYKEDSEKLKNAIITVASGEGLCKLFTELGADKIISGGQSMNPSCQDFIEACKNLNADNIFIYPNNSNIILAAKQCQDILTEKNINVVETKSIVAGVSSIGLIDKQGSVDEIISTSKQVIDNMVSASITYAVKDTTFDGVEVKQGDYIAMANKTILSSSTDLKEVVKVLLDELIKHEDKETLTVIFGEGSNEMINSFIEEYVSNNSDIEISFYEGDQPVYSYLFGLE